MEARAIWEPQTRTLAVGVPNQLTACWTKLIIKYTPLRLSRGGRHFFRGGGGAEKVLNNDSAESSRVNE